MSPWTDKYIGIPYVNRGRDRATGLDCWGLVCLVYEQELGITLPSYTDEYFAEECDIWADVIATHKGESYRYEEVPLTSIQPFDILLFRVMGFVCHTSIAVNPSIMLHTLRPHNSALERFTSSKWNRRLDGAFRVVAS
jgi:cell wall-associated NlpC family hydrolase